jgi:hypothetical protein
VSGAPNFSQKLLSSEEATNPGALERIALAKKRIASILDREIVSHQKTLEQKIAEQGPTPQRVDPHLIGLAVMDLQQLRRLRTHHHPATGDAGWYSNLLTPDAMIRQRLSELAPLYASVSGSGFGNLTGDALEIVVFKCLDAIFSANARFAYQGYFHLSGPKDANDRYKKTQPPRTIGANSTTKEADFLQFGHDAGPLCIECKNYREWIYPHHGIIKQLIVKADDLGAVPVLIARRIHYTTKTNLLEPAGIVAHESYFQYYPSDRAELAERVRDKRSLGFTDVMATEDPHPRTVKFFTSILPKILPQMASRWTSSREALREYAVGNINLAQLYTEVGSPAGGKWQDYEEPEPEY